MRAAAFLLPAFAMACVVESSQPSDPCAGNIPQSVRDQAKTQQNTAPVIHETTTTGGAPAPPAGGTITSGTYYLTQLLDYYPVDSPASPDPWQETLVIDAKAQTIVDVQYESGIYGQKNGSYGTAATYTLSGTTMTWTLDACTDMSLANQSISSVPYTATSTQLILPQMDVGPATYMVRTYTLQP